MERSTEAGIPPIALGKRIAEELNLLKRCRGYHLPLWQCPQLLFLGMGLVTIVSIAGFYFVALNEEYNPHSIALISTLLAGFFMLQMFIIMQAFERIAEANKIQVDFMNIAIHQLRSPVTAARWAMDRITTEETAGLSTETLQELYIVRDSVTKMAHLVSSILGIVRIEAGTVSAHTEVFSVNETIRDLVSATKWYARASNLKLEAKAPQHPMMVRADAEQVRFVLDHLLDNAMRYSRSAGTIEVALEEEAKMARVTVRDRGVGIPNEEQTKVFEKFFRATNAHALEPGGAGLSLFVGRTIIEAFGGHMGFNSEEGKGSAFWFTLPLVHEESPATAGSDKKQ
jgi:signal transduction histidine kinase